MSKNTIQSTSTEIIIIKTNPYSDQNPGTSGLRKKVKVFKQENYLHNFVQSIFNAHDEKEYKNKTLILGGDGRYYNDKAISIIIKIAIANGISNILVPQNGILSTPCVSVLIRQTENCFGGVILSASHNPGGEDEDFGIKFNSSNGAPSSEQITSRIFNSTKEIKEYKTLNTEEDLFGKAGSIIVDKNTEVQSVKFIDTCQAYVNLMQSLFDFKLIQNLFQKKGFSFVFDAMHGASGPYAISIFHEIFKVDKKNLINCDVLPDFGGHHPDPSLVHAKDLVNRLNINSN